MSTYEDVSHCPRCGEAGESQSGGRLPGGERGSSSITFTCRNSRCKWHETAWVVQVRADGTFPDALKKREKRFPELPPNMTIADSIETLQEMTTMRGAEIRN